MFPSCKLNHHQKADLNSRHLNYIRHSCMILLPAAPMQKFFQHWRYNSSYTFCVSFQNLVMYFSYFYTLFPKYNPKITLSTHLVTLVLKIFFGPNHVGPQNRHLICSNSLMIHPQTPPLTSSQEKSLRRLE